MIKAEDHLNELNIKKLEEYLRFLLTELNRYKEDWEITKDEFQMFKNEFVRFKEIINSSNNIPLVIKKAINKLSYNGRTKTKKTKYFFRYLYLWDAAAYRLNLLDDKDIIEKMEYDIKKILTQIELQ